MKTKSAKSHWNYSIISLLVLGIFIFLATGSLDLLSPLGIDVQKFDLGNGVYEEREFHASNNQEITTIGSTDKDGRWQGWVDIRYVKQNTDALIYTERVYMLHGRRNGICTRTYPNGTVEEEHYINGVRIGGLKSAQSGFAEGSAFNLVQDRYPWYLFMLEAFRFDKPYVENYMDTLELLLATYTFEPAQFDDYYDQVQDSLSETPYDSIIVSTNTLMGSIGIRRMKDHEFRLAVIDRYRAGGGSTFSILESAYPNYLNLMNVQGISPADLEVFCNDFDDTLSMYEVPDPEDAFFVDSVDARLLVALSSFLNSTKSQSALKGGATGDRSLLNSSAIFGIGMSTRGVSIGSSTPAEVAEAIFFGMIVLFLEGDLVREAVRDTYRGNAGLPGLPIAGTEFVSGNSATSVTLNGYVIEDGGAEVTARGIAWAEYYNPTLDDNSKASGSGIGQFSVTLDGLTQGNTYYARTYATNIAGTVYGNVISFVAEPTVGIAGTLVGNTEMTLFPNPASGWVTLSFANESVDGLEVVILDLSGRIVQRDQPGSSGKGPGEFIIDVSGIPSGLYRCQLFEKGIPVAGCELIIAR